MSKKKMPQHVAQTVIDRADGSCEVMNFPFCTGAAGPIHHRKISGREHSVSACIHICKPCHDWIHANPAVSYEQGWLVKMNYEPAAVPMKYRGMTAMLSEEGVVHYEYVG